MGGMRDSEGVAAVVAGDGYSDNQGGGGSDGDCNSRGGSGARGREEGGRGVFFRSADLADDQIV